MPQFGRSKERLGSDDMGGKVLVRSQGHWMEPIRLWGAPVVMSPLSCPTEQATGMTHALLHVLWGCLCLSTVLESGNLVSSGRCLGSWQSEAWPQPLPPCMAVRGTTSASP